MLYVFCGGDVVKTRQDAHDFIQTREAQGEVVRTLTLEEYELGAVQSVSMSAPLFGGVECIVFDSLSEHSDALKELKDSADILAQSPHTVVVIDGKFPADVAKALKSVAKKWNETKRDESERFNVFQLADALAKRDKKMLWLFLIRARSAGIVPEEIIGTLFWQLKSIRLTKMVATAAEADMKDFPWNKAKSASKNFSDSDLAHLSDSLVTLYHEGHLGTDIDLALEKWVLRV